MAGIDREQILRIDCPRCKGRGYVPDREKGETTCPAISEGGCDGSGMLEKKVPYKFETQGRRTPEEVAEAFGIGVEEVKNTGISSGDE